MGRGTPPRVRRRRRGSTADGSSVDLLAFGAARPKQPVEEVRTWPRATRVTPRLVSQGLSASAVLYPGTRSRPLYYGGGRSGQGGNLVDRTAPQGSGAHPQGENHHLAKVRVAGSNPVFRSILPGLGREEPQQRDGTEPPRSPRPTGTDRPGEDAGSAGTLAGAATTARRPHRGNEAEGLWGVEQCGAVRRCPIPNPGGARLGPQWRAR